MNNLGLHEDIRAEIVARMDAAQTHIDRSVVERDIAEAELREFDKLAALFSAPEAPAAPRKYDSVQHAVMGLFDHPGAKWTEGAIISETGLPTPSIHIFLRKALRQKKLRVEAGGVYSLPPAASATASVKGTLEPGAAGRMGRGHSRHPLPKTHQ